MSSMIRQDWRIIQPVNGGVIDSTTLDAIGNLEGLKRQVAVEHSEDDSLLTQYLLTAQQMVGSYIRWPMRTGQLMAELSLVQPVEGVLSDPLLYYAGMYGPRSCVPTMGFLRLPGPIQSGERASISYRLDGTWSTAVPSIEVLSGMDRLPHDGSLDLGQELRGVDCIEGLRITYPISWSSRYSGMEPWPTEVATTIYRVAATLYLYREATTLGDRPLHRIMQASLGPYLPVTL